MNPWKRYWLTALLLCLPLFLHGQRTDFSGLKIFINPGHGGYDGDDRHMIATDFWESEGNLAKGLFLRDLLQARGATVYMSRITNYTSDDLKLSVIAEMANQANADFFLSIHSNGFDGTRNQPLVLFRGYDNSPVYPAAKAMAQILWEKLYEKSNCWTHSFQWVKGDWTFYPEWGEQVGLGVLRTLSMPGVLSEGSFHDYIPEGWRLRNENHLHHEAWAMLRALQQHFNVAVEPTGIIAGTVRDELTAPPYYFGPGTSDQHKPINGATVTLKSSGRSVTIDNLNNGFFMFDSLPPGNYEVIAGGMADFYNDTLSASVIAGKTTLIDFLPSFDTARVPVVIEHFPSATDSLQFNQALSFRFNIPMNKLAVQSALVFEPDAGVTCEWDEKGMLLTVRPETGYASGTPYLIRLTTAATSRWNVHLAGEYQVSFVTKKRPKLVIEKIWPSHGADGITLFPRITMLFDAPIDQESARAGIRLLDSHSVPLMKKNEQFKSEGGKGSYSFEPASPLERNSVCRIEIDAGVKDISGTSVGTPVSATFTTRTMAYRSGNVIESFDNIDVFWDPETSGSTVGTDNQLTTFTASYNTYKVNAPAGRLDYHFTGDNGGVCRVFDTRKPGIGSNTSQLFAMWVYGDLSDNRLEYWFYSPGPDGTVNHVVPASTINWAGWDQITIPVSSIGGSGALHYHSIVVRQSSGGLKSGTMYFDDAIVFTPTGIEALPEELTELTVFPNPSAGEGRVSFILRSESNVDITLIASDGRLVASLFTGTLGPGEHIIPCNLLQVVAPGVYTLRLGISSGGKAWRYVSRRWAVLK